MPAEETTTSPLPTRQLGRTGLALTEVGLGGAPLANLFGEISDELAQQTVDAAWELGIRHFDTAPHYGLGLSERRMGGYLATKPRDGFVLSTKIGRLLVPNADGAGERDPEGFHVPADLRRVWDFSRDGVLRSIEDSLSRLGLDRIDIAYVHDPDEHHEQAATEAIPALIELREQGVVRAVGSGMNFSAPLTDFVRRTDIDVVMLAGRYTLFEQPALADLLPLAVERGVNVVIAGPYNSGLLSMPRPPADATYNYAPAPAHVLERANRLADVCERHGVTLPEAAIAFALGHPAVVSLVAGAVTPAQITETVQRYRQTVPAAVWDDLRDEGLLSPDAPTPA